MDEQINQGRLKNFLHYDPETGVFKWKDTFGWRAKQGTVAGSVKASGYIYIRLKLKQYRAHRLAWLYTYGKFPEDQIDHINGIKNDNRIINLRAVSDKENSRNLRLRKDNTSGYIGVRWDTDKWRVIILRKQYGRFKSKSDAIAKAKEVYKELGFHENHGKRVTANG
jgi:hypothetical protein